MQSEQSMKIIRERLETARRGGLLLVDFKAWAAPVAIGPLSMRERLDRWRTRAVWDDPQQAGVRVAVTVTEHLSAAQALQALAIELEANQLADLPPGPAGLGEVSFIHPAGVPPAVFFARANLTVWVMSFGNRPVEVVPIARVIDADLTSRPARVRAEGLEVAVTENVIRAKVRFGGDDAYLKVFAPGAELQKLDDAVVVVTGDVAEVEVFALEPGRETLSGTARLRR
jgi:hypothetical protein